jgi:predicted dithiol-disulfide oxidoreductase (DUF899 family)/DNA-binding transcriptional ArsR family regulator
VPISAEQPLDATWKAAGQLVTLAGRVPFSRQAVSKHLVVLERAGLVSRRKQGREVLYRVQAGRLDQAARAMAQLAAQWDRRLGTIKRLAETAHAETRRGTVMTDKPADPGGPAAGAASAPGLPVAVDRAAFQAELDRLRVREKAHTREGDAIAAARRRLPTVEVDASLPLAGPHGPLTLLEAFEGRRQLIAYYFMWRDGHPAAEQCDGCTWVTTQVSELSYLHSRGITYAVFCQGPYGESARGTPPRTRSMRSSSGAGPAGCTIVCYLRHGDRAFETYWTTLCGVEAMDYSYALMDLTVYGRQEPWEDWPPGWPQQCTITRTDGGPREWPPVPAWPGGRPIAQWPRLEAGRSDDLGTGHDGRQDARCGRADGDARA